jgi:hypothetical protein
MDHKIHLKKAWEEKREDNKWKGNRPYTILVTGKKKKIHILKIN